MRPIVKRIVTSALAVACAAAPLFADETPRQPAPVIELAILLDTSGSMDGLINQARARIWSIINQMASTKKDGVTPDLRVALFEYGKSSAPAAAGFVRQLVPLTDDLDKISSELFALTTNGGEEYCGAVIKTAVEQLSWTPGDHYQAIFIAGNEPFTQGTVDYKEACKLAISRGILVNTIHCGNAQEGINGQWKAAALLADGQSINIDQNAQSVAIAAPQDSKLEELSRKLNDTYVAYGDEGLARRELQKDQDKKAEAAAPGAGAERAIAKAGRGYKADSWDLVEAEEADRVDVATLKDEQLPEEMKGMDADQRKAYLEKKQAERKAVKDEIAKLSADRTKFIADEEKKRAGAGADTFDSAVRDILKEQLSKKGYKAE